MVFCRLRNKWIGKHISYTSGSLGSSVRGSLGHLVWPRFSFVCFRSAIAQPIFHVHFFALIFSFVCSVFSSFNTCFVKDSANVRPHAVRRLQHTTKAASAWHDSQLLWELDSHLTHHLITSNRKPRQKDYEYLLIKLKWKNNNNFISETPFWTAAAIFVC